MPFDFKKEYKEFYLPKNKPEIVTVPAANYIAVQGSGDPNEEGGAYQSAIRILYAVAYTLKMSYKTGRKIDGFFEYVVPPLEGFWWQNGVTGVDYTDKSAFHWISVIRLPDFVTGPWRPLPKRRSWTAPRQSSGRSMRDCVCRSCILARMTPNPQALRRWTPIWHRTATKTT